MRQKLSTNTNKAKNLNWNKILQDFEHYTRRIDNIYYNSKSREQLNQIPNIIKKRDSMIPPGTILEEKSIIKRFLILQNHSKEKFFTFLVDAYGIDLLNSIMYLNGIIQMDEVLMNIRNCFLTYSRFTVRL